MPENDPKLSTSPARKLLWPIAALALLLLFNLCFTEGFFVLKRASGTSDWYYCGDIIDILNYGSVIAVLALGMTLVISTGGVDLSVGSVMAMSGALAAVLVRDHNWHFLAAVGAALALSAAAGAWNGFLVAVLRVQPIVATLILMVTGRGIARLITDGQIIDFKDTANFARLAFFGSGRFLHLPFEIWIGAIMFAVTSVVVRRTAVGMLIEAVGDNETASHYSGVNARTTKALAYVFTGLCAGIAGVMAAGDIKAADPINTGQFIELDTILAVVIGGTALTGGRFYLIGSVTGALLIQTLTHTLIRQDVSPAVAPVPKSIVIIVVCLIQSPVFRNKVGRAIGRGGDT